MEKVKNPIWEAYFKVSYFLPNELIPLLKLVEQKCVHYIPRRISIFNIHDFRAKSKVYLFFGELMIFRVEGPSTSPKRY